MATTEQPFRFLDLPAEARLMVYGHLFHNSALCTTRRVSAISYWHLDKPDAVYKSGRLPPILTVCKPVRDEAEPVFLESYTLLFECPYYSDRTFEEQARAMPQKYLREVKIAFTYKCVLSFTHEGVLFSGALEQLPKLKEIHFNPSEAGERGDYSSDVELVKDTERWFRPHRFSRWISDVSSAYRLVIHDQNNDYDADLYIEYVVDFCSKTMIRRNPSKWLSSED